MFEIHGGGWTLGVAQVLFTSSMSSCYDFMSVRCVTIGLWNEEAPWFEGIEAEASSASKKPFLRFNGTGILEPICQYVEDVFRRVEGQRLSYYRSAPLSHCL